MQINENGVRLINLLLRKERRVLIGRQLLSMGLKWRCFAALESQARWNALLRAVKKNI